MVIEGQVPHQTDVNRLGNAIKTHPNWSTKVAADITAEHTDIHRFYTVEAGDTLGKIAKAFLGHASRYPEIFEANRDQLSDPDKIAVGQTLKIPNPS